LRLFTPNVSTHTPNRGQADYWNGDEAAHWLVHEDRYERMLQPFIAHLLGSAGISSSDRVLDIGCGCGATTRSAARVARAGEVLGVDLSGPLVACATKRARQEGLTNVGFEIADAQVHPFVASAFDVAVSRCGVMFFDDPVVAFANLTRALRPGGRLTFVCWQALLENEWITVPGLAAARYVALPELEGPGEPGPFALADPTRLRDILGAAGLADVEIRSVVEPLWLGSDVEDTVEFVKATGIGQTLLRGADPTTIARVSEAVAEALAAHLTPDGVRLGSAAWLVTALRASRADTGI
jgi:SAM-dependent methyltransferase